MRRFVGLEREVKVLFNDESMSGKRVSARTDEESESTNRGWELNTIGYLFVLNCLYIFYLKKVRILKWKFNNKKINFLFLHD